MTGYFVPLRSDFYYIISILHNLNTVFYKKHIVYIIRMKSVCGFVNYKNRSLFINLASKFNPLKFSAGQGGQELINGEILNAQFFAASLSIIIVVLL